MADVEELTVSYTRKVQLDQFEPITSFAEVEVSLEDGDDVDEVFDEYSERVEEMVERHIVERTTAAKIDGDDGDDE